MQSQNKSHAKRIRDLVIVCSLIAIILTVSTYAWFIGMRTVNVSSFDVEIAVADSLMLSLDGETWDTTVAITGENFDTVSYDGNTNNWGGEGLVPMSSIGAMDTNVSRMILFEKASLTATPGGYRLLSSRVHNYEELADEQDGYVVFDLFIRNFTGTQYLEELNLLDEEAIYLTPDSAVTVASVGGVAGTGIENSVRVAFAQIGRVKGTTTTVANITGITCNPDVNGQPSISAGLTGICRTAQIWEPNDVDHVANAISWYDTSCVKRTGTDVTLEASYSGTCNTIADGTAYATYAVSDDIASSDNVDIYDGAAYNTYTNSSLLVTYDYFTDTEKEKTGVQRPTFMTLAPNSITKVRIYIFIEGQDIDNYDFAAIGKKISVKFGLTKERFTEEDINYTGTPTQPGTDTTKPVITLLGESSVTHTLETPYVDAGATALDDVDGDITTKLKVINPVDVNVAGTYRITYNVTDWAGNYAVQVERIVTVQ